jgi:hypothetical protein
MGVPAVHEYGPALTASQPNAVGFDPASLTKLG